MAKKSDQVNIRIALEGGPEIVKTLNELGIDGEKVLKNLQKVGNLKADGTLQALRKVQAQFTTLGKQIDGIAKKFTSIGRSFSTRLTLPIVGAGVGILTQAANFEAATNDLAVNARLVGAEFDAASKKAQELGQASVFSSTEAAQGMTELAKVGLDYQQIMGGAADAMVNLAAANNAGLESSAGVVGDILNQFRLKASQLPGLVDQITGATIESRLSFDDYRLAIGQAGGAAGALGVKFDEFNAVLAATASSFTSGSDAGTSFKQFLVSLVPQSDKAAAIFDELNLQFFDAQGNMRSLADIAQELQDKFGRLSQQDLNKKVKTIFGVDALRTVLALIQLGGKGITDIMAKLKATDSAEIAKVRVKGLRGELDQFNSAVENLSIAIGKSGLLGFMTDLVKKGTDWAQTLSSLNSGTLSFGTKIAAVTAAIGPLVLGFGAIGRGVGFVMRGIGDLIGVFIKLRLLWISNPWVAAAAAVGVVAAGVAGAIQLWGNSTEDASVALEAHKKILADVKAAYDKVSGAVDDWAKKIEHTTLRQAIANYDKLFEAARQARTQLDQLPIYSEPMHLTGTAAEQAKQLSDLADQFKATGGDVDAFKAKIQSIDDVATDPAIHRYALELLNTADALRETETAVTQAKDVVTVFNGTAVEANAAMKRLAGDSVNGFSKAGDAADKAGQKVEDLKRKITVTSFGGDSGGPVKQVYDLSSGVAKAVDQSKTAVDGLEKSVDQSGDAVEGATGKITGSLATIPPAAQQAAGAVQEAFAGLDGGTAVTVATAILAPFQDLGGQIAAILDAAHGMTANGFGALRTEIAALATSIRAEIAQILAALRQAIDTARSMRAAADSGTLGGNNAPGLAAGGSVRGPGTSVSDSILAWLSNGEYVVNARATAQWLPFLEAINNFRLTKDQLRDHLKGFNLGGFVSGIRSSLDVGIPRLSTGGMIEKLALAPAAVGPSGMMNVRFDIGGETFDMVAPMDVASKLGRYATSSASNSTGRKPGWYK